LGRGDARVRRGRADRKAARRQEVPRCVRPGRLQGALGGVRPLCVRGGEPRHRRDRVGRTRPREGGRAAQAHPEREHDHRARRVRRARPEHRPAHLQVREPGRQVGPLGGLGVRLGQADAAGAQIQEALGLPPLELLLQQALNGVMLGVMYALVAVGFTLFFGVLDVIHFSHGDIFMLGAFTGLTVLAGLKAAGVGGALLALPLTFAASILVTGAIGVLAERVCVKPLAGTSPLMTLLATLSLGLVIREAVLIFYPRGADPKPFPQLLPQGGVELGGVAIRYENLAILGIGLAAMVAVDLVIRRTRMGAAIRAVAQEPEAAQMMGVNLDGTVDATFFLG